MKESRVVKGTIIEKRHGERRYYYYCRSRREKIDPGASGKTRGTGKSRVVSEQIYLGTAEAILNRFRNEDGASEVVRKEHWVPGLPLALFDLAVSSGLRRHIEESLCPELGGFRTADSLIVCAILGIQSRLQGSPPTFWSTPVGSSGRLVHEPLTTSQFVDVYKRWASSWDREESRDTPTVGVDEDLLTMEGLVRENAIRRVEEGVRRFVDHIGAPSLHSGTLFPMKFHFECDTRFGAVKPATASRSRPLSALRFMVPMEPGIPAMHTLKRGLSYDEDLVSDFHTEPVSPFGTGKSDLSALVFSCDIPEMMRLMEALPPEMDFVAPVALQHQELISAASKSSHCERYGPVHVRRSRQAVHGRILTFLHLEGPSAPGIFHACTGHGESWFGHPNKSAMVGGAIPDFRSFGPNGFVESFHSRCPDHSATVLATSLHDTPTFTILNYWKKTAEIGYILDHCVDWRIGAYGDDFPWTDSRRRIHACITHLALVLLTLLGFQCRFTGYGMTIPLLLAELSDIRVRISEERSRSAPENPCRLSRSQEHLLDLFNLRR